MTSFSTAIDIDIAIRLIRAYMARHPHAADTLEGVAQWWLAGQFSPDIVAAALAQLRAAGELECQALGERALWRVHRSGA